MKQEDFMCVGVRVRKLLGMVLAGAGFLCGDALLARELAREADELPWRNENGWVRAHCPGRHEHENADGTRADCVTDELAIEVDFPDSWAECHGQAIRYGRVNPDLRGACWLLCGKADRGSCAVKAWGLKRDAAGTGILIECRSWQTGNEVDCGDDDD